MALVDVNLEGKDCPICLEEFNANGKIIFFHPCSHAAHPFCFEEYLFDELGKTAESLKRGEFHIPMKCMCCRQAIRRTVAVKNAITLSVQQRKSILKAQREADPAYKVDIQTKVYVACRNMMTVFPPTVDMYYL